ncbi:hypothetical protein K6L44_07260 [Gluconacetobacter entanii]|uniref:hypothetical protein n=1 Tax=Gluconacetobacter entanii TaxID=108528 RepID=UPI001C93473E|nr:hypothetical protein [Gluconacetobacter entanii]MBY4639794.1 hypothetical protein [Gluconacetobacter entanii]MCW4580661.1 hypothetical protein [Gluconacetobacter entanii]MCW4583949.1 hypothetical protein [Gluconacetobacter entanii]MCW4587335.1 hypothetical protein [Gluconacetobacter entanii]
MTDETPPPDRAKAESARAEAARLARQQREAQALRDNLRRRKQQSRARTAPDAAATPDVLPGAPTATPSPRDDVPST